MRYSTKSVDEVADQFRAQGLNLTDSISLAQIAHGAVRRRLRHPDYSLEGTGPVGVSFTVLDRTLEAEVGKIFE